MPPGRGDTLTLRWATGQAYQNWCVWGGGARGREGEKWHFQERSLLLGYKAAQHVPGSAANFLWASVYLLVQSRARRTGEGLRKNDGP